MHSTNPFKYSKPSADIIRRAVMLHERFLLSLRNVEDLLHARGVAVRHKASRWRWNRFGPVFASEIKQRRIAGMKSSRRRWHLGENFVKFNGGRINLRRAVDPEGEVLRSCVTMTHDKKATLRFLRKATRMQGRPEVILTSRLRAYDAALKKIEASERQPTIRRLNKCAEIFRLSFRRREPAILRFWAQAEFVDVRRPRLNGQPLQPGPQTLKSNRPQGEPPRLSSGWCVLSGNVACKG